MNAVLNVCDISILIWISNISYFCLYDSSMVHVPDCSIRFELTDLVQYLSGFMIFVDLYWYIPNLVFF